MSRALVVTASLLAIEFCRCFFPSSAGAQNRASIQVELTLRIVVLSDKRVTVAGSTNLPRGTELLLDVEEEDGAGFHGQSHCFVNADKTFESEAFGRSGGLEDGSYIAQVTMPIARVQSSEVQAVIGEQGQNLSGRLVERGKFGATVSQSAKFVIGGSSAAKAQTDRVKKSEDDSVELKRKLCVLLEQLLSFKDKPDFKEYGFAIRGPYNPWLKEVERLRDAQPIGADRVSFKLRIAPGDLLTLGMAYIGGKETQYTRDILPEIKETIGFSNYLATKQRDAPATVRATNQSSTPTAAKAPLRVWRDSTGKFTVEASLSATKDGVVVLLKRNGTSIEVPLERLSTADREFVTRDPFVP